MLTNIFANNRKLHKFATTNSNFEKIDYFRHVSKYNEHVGYTNFQQNRVSINQSKPCTQSNLQKFVTIRISKPNFFQTCIIV